MGDSFPGELFLNNNNVSFMHRVMIWLDLIVFLQLFEMGLELSLARLKALAKFAFGMGLSQVNRLYSFL